MKSVHQIIREVAETTRRGKWGDNPGRLYTTPKRWRDEDGVWRDWWHPGKAWLMCGYDLTICASVPLETIRKTYERIGTNQAEWLKAVEEWHKKEVTTWFH